MASYVEMIGNQRLEIDALRAQLGMQVASPADEKAAAALERDLAQARTELAQTRDQLIEARNEVDVLQLRVAERDGIIDNLSAAPISNNAALLDQIAQLERDLFERDERIASLSEAARAAAAAKPAAPQPAAADDAQKRRVRELERDLQRARDEFKALENEQEKLLGDMAQLEIDNVNFRERLRALGDRV